MKTQADLKRQTAKLSIYSNTTLVLLKLAVGLFVGAVSLISEALHSGIDLVASLIAFWAVRKSEVPPDQEHDYGHGKYENLSAAIEALLIVGAAIGIIYEAVEKFREAKAPDGSYRIAWMEDGETSHQLELTWLQNHPQAYDLGENEFHLAVYAEDYEKAHALHSELGIICYENPAMGIYFIHDPDDYWTEILPPR